MSEDPIVAEVRAVRATHAERFNNDLLAIYLDLKTQEQRSNHEFVSYPARRIALADEGQGTALPPPR